MKTLKVDWETNRYFKSYFNVSFGLHQFRKIAHSHHNPIFLWWTHTEQDVRRRKTTTISQSSGSWGMTGVNPKTEMRKNPDRMSGFFYDFIILFCSECLTFKSHTIPAMLHKLTNILMICTFWCCKHRSIMFCKQI